MYRNKSTGYQHNASNQRFLVIRPLRSKDIRLMDPRFSLTYKSLRSEARAALSKQLLRRMRRIFFSTKSGKTSGKAVNVNRKKAPSKGVNDKNGNKELPSSGFIGKTKFDLLVPMYQQTIQEKIPELSLRVLLEKTSSVHDKYIRSYGVVEGTAKWKAITLYATGLLEGREPKNPGWVSTGKVDKWPNQIGHLRPLFHFIKNNVHNEAESFHVTEFRRILVILFKLNRVCEGNKVLDLGDKSSKFNLSPELHSSFERFAREKLQGVRESFDSTALSFDLYISPKKGPNGIRMQDSAYAEAATLAKHKKLGKAFRELCTLTGNYSFLEFFEQCSKRMIGLDDNKTILRKITSVSDKGNRSRIIAISDFWTQSALAALEKYVIQVTDELYKEQCCYFSHDEGWAKIMALPSEVQATLASLDATEWTDNLPASLQIIVMKAIFGQNIAHAWKALAVDCEWSVPSLSRTFKYGRGQGMGTKGSFVIAQLTDLIFMDFILKRVYPEVPTPFFIKVGDDLVSYDPKLLLRDQYAKIGVPINLTKSKFKTPHGNFIEFVSRNSWNGNDYSIISPSLLPKLRKDDFYSATFFHHVKERSGNLKDFDSVITLKQSLIENKANALEGFLDRSRIIKMIINLIGHIEGNFLSDTTKSPWITLPREELLSFLEIWIKAILGEFLFSISIDQLKEEKVGPRKRFELLYGEYSISAGGPKFVKNFDPRLFFDLAIKNNLSLEETIALRQSLTTICSFNKGFEKGQIFVSEIHELDNHQELTLFAKKDSCDILVAKPQTLGLLLEIVDKIGQQEVGYKTVQRLSYFNKVNTKTSIHLHSHLYRVLKLKESPLDMSTGIYTHHSGKSYEFSLPLLKAFSELLRFDSFLSEIDSLRQNEGSELILHDIDTTEENSSPLAAPAQGAEEVGSEEPSSGQREE